jgi:hypothetical protein
LPLWLRDTILKRWFKSNLDTIKINFDIYRRRWAASWKDDFRFNFRSIEWDRNKLVSWDWRLSLPRPSQRRYLPEHKKTSCYIKGLLRESISTYKKKLYCLQINFSGLFKFIHFFRLVCWHYLMKLSVPSCKYNTECSNSNL